MKYHQYSNKNNFFLIGLILFIFVGGFRLIYILLGIAVAILLNFLPLILIGSFFYMLSGRMRRNNSLRTYITKEGNAHQRFVELLTYISMYVINADNKIDERERIAIKSFFSVQMRFTGTQLLWIDDLLSEAEKQPYRLEHLCDEFNQRFQINAKQLLIDLLFRIGLADGHLASVEESLIYKIGQLLKISEFDIKQIRALHVKEEHHTEYYTILGVSESTTATELKNAYRNAAKKHHPDKVAHLGASFKAAAEEKMRKINMAYDTLSKKHR